METNSNFISHHNSGFQLTFENGYTVSVQWGACTYSNHHNFPEGIRHSSQKTFLEWIESPHNEENITKGWKSRTAEVAVWTLKGSKDDPQRTWYNPLTLEKPNSSTDVAGYLNPNEVAEIISKVASIKTKGDNPLANLLDMTDKIVDKGKTIWSRAK